MVVSGFRIEALIGRGATGAVYRARQDERLIALKLLDEHLGEDERFRQRFLRESHLAAHIDHAHVVRTIGSGDADGRLFLAMEYVEGTDLRQLLQSDGRLDPERAVAIVEQVASALDAAHAAGLVHRDVKPGNILLRPDGHAYVCDFGLARHVTSPSSLTGDRGFVGTIDYVPPEQIEGGTVGPPADVYSLGCVLYECLSGARPFERDSELAVVFAHLNEPPPRVTDLRPELPAAFDDVMATALAKSPAERYGSCGELAAAARAACDGKVLRPRRPRRRRIVASALAVALAAGATATAVLLSRSPTHGVVTITPTSIRGARLGDSNTLLGKMWHHGQKLTMQTPGNYNVLTQKARNVSAYFDGARDSAVEITTSNSNDRTAEGIGPCSTLAELRHVYGPRLKASPNMTHAGLVFGWTVGKHLLFAMGPSPSTNPNVVESVALYDNDLGSAGFIASNDGPCAPAAVDTAVVRPAVTPPTTASRLVSTAASSRFHPAVSLKTPRGWTVHGDSSSLFDIASASGTTIRFRLDPLPSTRTGRPIQNVSLTAAGLAGWLQGGSRFAVRRGAESFVGGQSFTATRVDLAPKAGSTPYFTFDAAHGPAALVATGGRATRLYLLPIRIGTLVHTLVVAVDAPTRATLAAEGDVVDAMVKTIHVNAAAGSSLTALSALCTPVYRGTCRGELSAGTYTTQTFQPQATYTVPVGWTNAGDGRGFFDLIPPGGDYAAVDAGLSDYVGVFTSIATAREGCAEGAGAFHTPTTFVRWLQHEPALVLTRPERVRIGGLPGFRVDIRIKRSWAKTCPGDDVAAVQIFTGLAPSPDDLSHGVIPQPVVMRLYVLAYRRGTLGIEVDDMRGDSRLDEYSKIVQTFRFKSS